MRVGAARAPNANGTTPAPERNEAALIDTGASGSCISEDLAKELGLPIVDRMEVTGVGGRRVHNVYLAHVVVKQLGVESRGAFIGVPRLGAQPLLVGRDFLANVVLIYDGVTGVVTICN